MQQPLHPTRPDTPTQASPAFGTRLAIAALALVALLTWRNMGVHATVMWDEWEYSRFARQLPLDLADVPYYLYYLLYRSTNACGAGFLGCAQLLNALFLAASLPLLYHVARRVTSPRLAMLVALTATFGGFSAYATHFTPESLYFFGVWLGLFALLKTLDTNPGASKLGLGLGAFLGLLALVKLHAMFLVPGALLFLLLETCSGKVPGGVGAFLRHAALLLLAFFGVRLGLGYALAGEAGLHLFGDAYNHAAQTALPTPAALQTLAQNAAPLLLRHILALATLFTLPFLLLFTPRLDLPAPVAARVGSLRALLGSLLPPLLLVVALYSAHVRAVSPEIEGSTSVRLLMRYYNFLFPLLSMLAAAVVTHGATAQKFSRQRLLGAVVMAALTACFILDLDHNQLSLFDAPELRGYATLAPARTALLGLTLLLFILWIGSRREAAKLYLYVYLPLLTLLGGAAAHVSAHKELTPNLYQQAGSFARVWLGEDLAKLTILSPDIMGAYQAMFAADHPAIAHAEFPEQTCLTASATPEKEWLLLIGAYKINAKTEATIARPGFTLLHLKAAPGATTNLTPCAKTPAPTPKHSAPPGRATPAKAGAQR